MKYTTLFIDLDGTVYDNQTGLWDMIRVRMNDYVQRLLQLPPDETAALRRHYYETYGTTLRGLQIHHRVNADEYLAYVHDIPLADYIKPDPELRSFLISLPQNKFIFTNADLAHATRTLDVIGIRDCFDGIIDVRALQFHCKPEPEAYQIAQRLAGENNPEQCIIIDDSELNLAGARQMGMITVLVGRNGPHPCAHFQIDKLNDLQRVIPELWSDHIR